MEKILTKVELKKAYKRFAADEKRGISLKLFADMCGVSFERLNEVLIHDKDTMSQMIQIRVSRTLEAHRKGQLRVMENPNNKTRRVEFRPKGEEKPRLMRAISFGLSNGKITIQPGVVNRQDFTRPDLDDLLGE